jgi:hypothetical protein
LDHPLLAFLVDLPLLAYLPFLAYLEYLEYLGPKNELINNHKKTNFLA